MAIVIQDRFGIDKEYASIEDVPKHDYDWGQLVEENGKKNYVDVNGEKALVGIDVSRHQKSIEWEKVKNDGIDFAIIRVGYRGYEIGRLILDDRFKYNIENAIGVGIDVGVYFFSQATTEEEAIEEAEFLIKHIKGYRIKGPVVFDLEELGSINSRIDNLTTEERTNVALAFCKVIKKAGYDPMIYASRSHLLNQYYLNKIAKYEIWVAEYNVSPLFEYDFRIWQYTDKGKVDGISTNVDLNIYFKK